MVCVAAASEVVDEQSRGRFSSKHLTKVLDQCFSASELGGKGGFLAKCLELDGPAFQGVRAGTGKRKEDRLMAVAESRPGGCQDAADLLLWLVKVRGSGLERWGVDARLSCRAAGPRDVGLSVSEASTR